MTFKKGICPKCKKVRYIFKTKILDTKPAFRCGKCGYVWTSKTEGKDGRD